MNQEILHYNKLEEAMLSFKNAQPFHHAVIDDFLTESWARHVSKEFIGYDEPKWFCYKNKIEDKKALNDWNVFPSYTYRLFEHLNSARMLETLSSLVGTELHADFGLHGGGWHIHGTGGNLNPHLDYTIQPKLKLQRKLNLIIYVSADLKEEHGGHLGLWTHDQTTKRPGRLIKEVAPKFNRAILFDTTQNSWHGLSRPLIQPQGIYRKSLAVYYLCEPAENVDGRERALFAPRDEQKSDDEIEELIRMRSDLNLSKLVYRQS